MTDWPRFLLKNRFGVFLSFMLVIAFTFAGMAEEEVPNGGWLDEIVATEEANTAAGVSLLQQGEIDIFGHSMTNPELFEKVREDENITYFQSYGSYNELTFNPGGDPTFAETGEFNPFSSARIREAMNYLVDREYIAEEIMGGLAKPNYLPIASSFNDYSQFIVKARELEAKYAYDKTLAEEIVSEEMEKMGAEKNDGIWHYDGEPIELEVVIRVEDERKDIGDYFCNQLEDIGFEVVRNYVTMEEQSPLTLLAEPEDGTFHATTMGWLFPYIYRDEATTFAMMHTDRVYSFPLFQYYDPGEEFEELANRLYDRDFETMEERNELFEKALEMTMENSYKITVVDSIAYTPYRQEVAVSGDLAAGITGSMVWPYTARFKDRVGGTLDIALSSLFDQPWNPLDGTNNTYDLMLIEATGDPGYIADPYTGYHYPMRFEKAEVFIEEGLPVTSELDWVDLEFVEENVVPGDAWADWDPEEQEFITADERFSEETTANQKMVVHYPEDLFETVTWHDGSPITMADFIYRFILEFDRGQEESPMYDPAKESAYLNFMNNFRGMKIVSTDPLVIEYYTDSYTLDAEQDLVTLFPNYPADQGPGAWHNLALGQLAELEELAAFTQDKADELNGEWLNFVGGPSLDILNDMLEKAQAENFIPYESTLSEFLEEGEVEERYSNLAAWYEENENFWLGTGPYYLSAAHPVEKIVHLERFEDHPDPADRWNIFDEPMRPEVDVKARGVVNIGSEADFDITVTYDGDPYPSEMLDEVKYILFNSNDEVVHTGDAEMDSEGEWKINLSGEVTDKLSTGTSRFEVIVTSNVITLPSIEELQFVTIP